MFGFDQLLSVLKTAYKATVRQWRVMLMAVLIVAGILLLFTLLSVQLMGYFWGISLTAEDSLEQMLMPLQYLLLIVSAPLEAGLAWLGLGAFLGKNIRPQQVFYAMPLSAGLIVIALVSSALVNLGLQLLLFPGIYLMAVLSFANLYYLQHQGTPLQAMWRSAKVVHHHFGLVLGFNGAMIGLFMLAAIPFGLGLVFAVPFYFIGKGVLYHRLFSVDDMPEPEEQTSESPVIAPTKFEA
ncbi:MAG: hypothetical protein R3Y10_08240 [Ferrimonas sp.]